MIERMTDYVANNYAPVTESGCWLWLGAVDGKGYGKLGQHGRNFIAAHRLFYTFHVGPITGGLHVLHKCDTPLCVNPTHLRLGTHQENMKDMQAKGRSRWAGNLRNLARKAA